MTAKRLATLVIWTVLVAAFTQYAVEILLWILEPGPLDFMSRLWAAQGLFWSSAGLIYSLVSLWEAGDPNHPV